jgi:hypothetical protein
MESTARFTFSTPESAYSKGRPAVTRCLPAASNTWHVFDGSKRSVTVHARIKQSSIGIIAANSQEGGALNQDGGPVHSFRLHGMRLGWQRLPAPTSRPWHPMCSYAAFGANGAQGTADKSNWKGKK